MDSIWPPRITSLWSKSQKYLAGDFSTFETCLYVGAKKEKKQRGFGNGRKKSWGRERLKEGIKIGKEGERTGKWGRLENIKQKSKAKPNEADIKVSETNGETSSQTASLFPKGLIVLPANCVKDILLWSHKYTILLQQRRETHSSSSVFLLNSLQCFCRR